MIFWGSVPPFRWLRVWDSWNFDVLFFFTDFGETSLNLEYCLQAPLRIHQTSRISCLFVCTVFKLWSGLFWLSKYNRKIEPDFFAKHSRVKQASKTSRKVKWFQCFNVHRRSKKTSTANMSPIATCSTRCFGEQTRLESLPKAKTRGDSVKFHWEFFVH